MFGRNRVVDVILGISLVLVSLFFLVGAIFNISSSLAVENGFEKYWPILAIQVGLSLVSGFVSLYLLKQD